MFNLLKSSFAVAVLMFSSVVNSETVRVTGKVSSITVPTNTDINTFYFKLDPMPADIKHSFFVRYGNGNYKSCKLLGNENTTNRAYSAILTAKSTGKPITITYCDAGDGYGLVNGKITIN